MKYRPEFPDRFGSHEDGISFCRSFFKWYNDEHYHTGIGLLTPAVLHYGEAPGVIEAREQVLSSAYAKHPERFVGGCPRPQSLPTAVWINPPKIKTNDDKKGLPETHCPRKPDAPQAHPRPGYPSSDQPSVGARVPAELDSVSPSDVEPNRPLEILQPL